MLRLATVIVSAVLALGTLAGCDDGDGSGLVFKDPKGTVEVESGMTFSLELSVNAGVGYDWEPVGGPDPRVLELIDTVVDYPDEEREGDSGKKRFVYEAKATGTQTVVLRRLYRGDEDERRRITVRIRE